MVVVKTILWLLVFYRKKEKVSLLQYEKKGLTQYQQKEREIVKLLLLFDQITHHHEQVLEHTQHSITCQTLLISINTNGHTKS